MRAVPRVMPAIVTPFGPNGDVDLDAHRHNVDMLTGDGVTGFVIGGSNGEGPYLEPGERAALARATRDAAPDAFVLVGTVAESLRMALAQAAEAADSGADAILATTPTTLVRHRPDLVAGYYEALGSTTDLPVFLYSVPRVTAYDLPLDTAAGLASVPGVIGIKDSSGDLDRAATLAAMPFTVLIGSSAIASAGVEAGAHGVITASTNYAWRLVLAVVAAALDGMPDTSGQDRLTTVAKAVEAFGVPGVKLAASKVGLVTGGCRLPLREPDGDASDAVERALDAARA